MENENGPTLGNGKICYVEIPADDIAQSAAFYSEIFGWKTRKRGDGRLAFDDGINEVSGAWVTGRKKHSEAGFILSIMVDSVAETMKKITDHGCPVVTTSREVPANSGRFWVPPSAACPLNLAHEDVEASTD